jgi:hypothetical protein
VYFSNFLNAEVAQHFFFWLVLHWTELLETTNEKPKDMNGQLSFDKIFW